MKLVGESRCSEYLYFLWNYLQTHNIDVRLCTSRLSLDYRRKKRRMGYVHVTPRLQFHHLILFIPSLTRKLHFLDKIRHNSHVKWTGWGIHRDKLSYWWFYSVYTPTVYRGILIFFKQTGNSSIWMLLLLEWLYLWVSFNL